jgi:hypothetical protein
MSRYQQLKEQAHNQVCEWMRCLDWRETATPETLKGMIASIFRNRHKDRPRFKRATCAWNKRQTVRLPSEERRRAVLYLARLELIESDHLFR